MAENHIFNKIRKGSQAEQLAQLLSVRPRGGDPRNYRTAGDMQGAGLGMVQSCSDCGAKRRFTAQELVETFGAETELKHVKPDCATCGSKAQVMMPG